MAKAATVHRSLADIMAVMSRAERNRKIAIAFNPITGYLKRQRY
jgi:hypothetical protein